MQQLFTLNLEMEKHEDVTSILSMINLDNMEKTIKEPYHQTGAGIPP